MNIYHVCISLLFFFFTDPPTPEIYTLSLHDALPISSFSRPRWRSSSSAPVRRPRKDISRRRAEGYLKMDQTALESHGNRSEEHTSELQSPDHLVCRLLLEKKNR